MDRPDPRSARKTFESLPTSPPCPFCKDSGRPAGNTELMSAFGSHASVSTYWCTTCRSPFEVFKWRSP